MSKERESLNQIYSVGHQTLDARRARFLENNILVEKRTRDKLYQRSSITRQYDPILELDVRQEELKSYKNQQQHCDKAELLKTHRNNVSKLHDDSEHLRYLENKRKVLAKQMHLMERNFGDARTRDRCLHTDPKQITVVPPESSYYSKLNTIKADQKNHQRQFLENAELAAIMQKNKELKYRNPDKETLPVKPITPEVFPTAIRSFGGSDSMSSTQFLNIHEPTGVPIAGKKKSNNGASVRAQGHVPYEHNMSDYNAVVLQHNRLLSCPRPTRNTLMLSGMGFKEHCTDVALEIVKILNDRNL